MAGRGSPAEQLDIDTKLLQWLEGMGMDEEPDTNRIEHDIDEDRHHDTVVNS